MCAVSLHSIASYGRMQLSMESTFAPVPVNTKNGCAVAPNSRLISASASCVYGSPPYAGTGPLLARTTASITSGCAGAQLSLAKLGSVLGSVFVSCMAEVWTGRALPSSSSTSDVSMKIVRSVHQLFDLQLPESASHYVRDSPVPLEPPLDHDEARVFHDIVVALDDLWRDDHVDETPLVFEQDEDGALCTARSLTHGYET